MESIRVVPSDIPSPPTAIAQIVRRASDPDVTGVQLGALIGADPAFTAELLRTVNAPFYGLKQQVASASRAAVVLGSRALRNLAVCFAVRDSLRNSPFPASVLTTFWEDSVRRAAAARALARLVAPAMAEEAFTVGLLQDFGVLGLLTAARADAGAWAELRVLPPEFRREEEERRFGITHDQLASALGTRWGLPPSLVQALAWHHDPKQCPAAHRGMALVASGADAVAGVFTAGDTNATLEACREVLVRDFGMRPESTDAFLTRIGPELEEAAAGLGMRVATQPRWDEIVQQANRTLVEMNTSYEELTTRLERTLREKEEVEKKLLAAYRELEMVAWFDPLTGLCNRRRFDEVFRHEVARAAHSGGFVSLVMLDLDQFKRLNDTWGHPFGDAVLQAVARCMMTTARTSDLKARLGGEELALVLPDTDASGAWAVAEAVRVAIAAMPLTTANAEVRVTASFGGATWKGSPGDEPERVLRMLCDAADQALYRSKHQGRDRVSWSGEPARADIRLVSRA